MPASCPASPALDQLADFARWEAELHTNSTDTQSALVKRLREVPDRRGDKGRRHPLVVILTLTACATLVVGSDSHSNMYGSLGALGTPVVRTDAAAIWATETDTSGTPSAGASGVSGGSPVSAVMRSRIGASALTRSRTMPSPPRRSSPSITCKAIS